MRLLHVETRQLEEFFGDKIPPYAILSHTWDEEEVSFQDLQKENHQQKRGYRKIEGCCQQAIREGLMYVWVDTCCIDKCSSAELSEAINSMFKWYEDARICYVFMQDVPPGSDPFERKSAFQSSRWFSRGWTLQELLAPKQIVFYASDWTPIFKPTASRKKSYMETAPLAGDASTKTFKSPLLTMLNREPALLSGITGIFEPVLRRVVPLSSVSAACKFSWAAARRTTREEDMAYCLLGLLGINMPLLYGEGHKAFVRLQEIILSSSDDISILAWGYDLSWKICRNEYRATVLAKSATAFQGFPRGNRHYVRRTPQSPTFMTGHGLHIELPMIQIDRRNKTWLGIIEEHSDRYDGNQTGMAIVLKQCEGKATNIFERAGGCPPIRIFDLPLLQRMWRSMSPKLIYLQDSKVTAPSRVNTEMEHSLFKHVLSSSLSKPSLLISLDSINRAGYFLSSLYPPIGRGHFVTQHDSDGTHQPYDALGCDGAQNREFFSIFASDRENRFAMRVQIVSHAFSVKPFHVTFFRLDVNIHGTAMEHCHDTKIGWKAPMLQKQMQWSEQVDVKNAVTLDLGYARATHIPHRLQSSGTEVDCWLEWVKGVL